MGSFFVSDHGTGTKCGGGSGILINKQVRRFFSDEITEKLLPADITSADKRDIQRKNRKIMQHQVEKMHLKAAENNNECLIKS